MLVNIQAFCDGTDYTMVNSYGRFESLFCLLLQNQAVQEDEALLGLFDPEYDSTKTLRNFG
jgi:hypothetical protein